MSEYLPEWRVAELAEGTPVTVTWSGGNGPHDYVVTVDGRGQRYVCQQKNIDDDDRMRFYNPLTFVGVERFHTRVSLR